MQRACTLNKKSISYSYDGLLASGRGEFWEEEARNYPRQQC